MGIVNKMVNFVKFISYFNRLKKTFISISTTDSYKDDIYYDRLENDANNFLKLASEMELEEQNTLMQTVDWLKSEGRFINMFVKGEYEDAFHFSKKRLNDSYSNLNKYYSSNAIMLVINELKSRIPIDEFNKKFREDEAETKAMLNVFASDGRGLSSDVDIVEITYSGARMSLAYNAFLSGDKDETEHQFKEHIKTYGAEKTIEKESPNSVPWFFKNVSPKYIEFMHAFLDQVQSMQEKKIKTSL